MDNDKYDLALERAERSARTGRRQLWESQVRSAAKPDQASSPADTAKVMVSSEPSGTEIYVDGNFMGNTPSLIDLPAGSHTVRVEAKGRASWSRTATLTTGSKITVQAVLSPEP
jgi:PEGA domain